MKNLLRELKTICNQNPLGEKVLLASSHSSGRQIIQALIKSGQPCLNLKAMTLTDLVEELCMPYLYKHGLTLIPSTLANHLMFNTLIRLAPDLQYFNRLKITFGFSGVMLRAILELKMAGLTVNDLQDSSFISTEKGSDLRRIFAGYQQALAENSYIDVPDLFKLALTAPSLGNQETVYIIISSTQLQELERQFLQQFAADRVKIISLTTIQGLNSPTGYQANKLEFKEIANKENAFKDLAIKDIAIQDIAIQEKANKDIDRMKWLYQLDQAPKPFGDGSIAILQAQGETNEAREVLRRIKSSQVQFDQVAVFYTAREPYSQLFYNLAQSLKLPITLGEGIDLRNTRPGKLFFGILAWINSNYNVAELHPLLTSGVFLIPDQEVLSAPKLAGILRELGIGWGRERYFTCLEELIRESDMKLTRELEMKLTGSGDGEKSELFQALLIELNWLKSFISKLFERLPIPDSSGQLVCGEFLKGIAGLMDDYARISDEADAEAKQVIIEELSTIANNAGESTSLEEAVLQVQTLLEGARIQRLSPKPGHLHICHYQQGVWVNRPCNFVVGLDAQRFPGPTREDPIILDLERERLGSCLKLNKENSSENTYRMVQLLASLPGTVTLSYPAFDTVENREMFPASLLLQVYRLMTGDRTKDYSQLLAHFTGQKGFVPLVEADVLEEAEWWLNRAFTGPEIKNLQETLVNCNANLHHGLLALEQRRSSAFTKFDGKVAVDTAQVDPRKNHELVMSSSQLEKLAHCPFAYFLNYILKIKLPEEMEYDPGIWLNAATRGTLFHTIFEKFYKDLNRQGEKPSLSKHKSYLYELANELVAVQKAQVPPPNEVVYEHEYREILESCRVFLASEEQESQRVTPSYFELSFGLQGEGNENIGEIAPIPVELANGDAFYLRGKIDRVDLKSDGTYKTLDYKTGSTYAYAQSKYFKGGRQLQHTLYAIALEKILLAKQCAANPRVSEGGYIFPTIKGEGSRVMRSQDKREQLQEILGHLLDILGSGAFSMTDDESDCRFCDYANVCQRELVWAGLEEMRNNPQNAGLESFRRLRTYE